MECELIELAAMEMAKADLGHNAWAMMPEAERNVWKARAQFVVPIILERAAKVADGWLATFGDRPIVHVPAMTYASDAVKDIASAIRALAPSGEGEGK